MTFVGIDRLYTVKRITLAGRAALVGVTVLQKDCPTKL